MIGTKLSGMGIRKSSQIPGTLDNGHLQSKTNTEKGNVMGASVFDRNDLAFHSPFPEPRSNQNPIHTREMLGDFFVF